MRILKLSNGHSLSVESLDKKVRLIVYNDGAEEVCRKSTLKSIMHFIHSNDRQLFKGRLQLSRNEAGINIMVKGTRVGEIPVPDFVNYLENA